MVLKFLSPRKAEMSINYLKLIIFLPLFTDNIFAIKSWAKRKFGFEDNKIDKTFGIPDDFDYID